MVLASLGPVRLALFAWWCLEANGQLRRHPQTQSGQETANKPLGAAKAHFSDLFGQTHTREPVLLESLPEIILEVIQF